MPCAPSGTLRDLLLLLSLAVTLLLATSRRTVAADPYWAPGAGLQPHRQAVDAVPQPDSHPFQVVEAQAIELPPPNVSLEGVAPGEPFVVDTAPVGLPEAGTYDPYSYGPYGDYVPPVPYSEYCRWTRVYRSWFLGRLWTEGQILGWATSDADYPVLLTSASVAAPGVAGQLDQPDTAIQFGGEPLHGAMHLGGRLTIGLWWDPSQWGGIQGSYFGLEGEEERASFTGTGANIFARPFVDEATGLEEAQLSIYPGLLSGGVALEADTDLSGMEALLRRMLIGRDGLRMDLLAGYRYGRLADTVFVDEVLLSLDPSTGFPTGTAIQRRDDFLTESEFHGGEVGLVTRMWRGCWSLELTSKVALGSTRSDLLIDGFTTTRDTTVPGSPTIRTAGGVLAQPTNIGEFSDAEVAYMSELGVSLVYEIDCHLHASVGYTALYWNRVARVGHQIDRVIGTTRPEADLEHSDFWAQGLTLGIHHQF